MSKPFRDTRLGGWLKKHAPDLLDKADDFFPPLSLITAAVKSKGLGEDVMKEFDEAAAGYEENERRDWLADIANARNREIEVAKTGKHDHLMFVSGYVALGAFGVMIYAVIWRPVDVGHNPLFHQLMGIIEGVALSVFGYYFGASIKRK